MAVAVSVINVLELSSATRPKQKSKNEDGNKNVIEIMTPEDFSERIDVIKPPEKIIKHTEDTLEDISSEKEVNIQNSRLFEEIDDSKNASYWNGFHAISVLIVCIFNTAIITLIPRNNSLEQPQYWYECIILYVFGFVCRMPFLVIMVLYFFTNTKQLLSVKKCQE